MNGERQFGPYRLIRQVAVGGMAEIHLARTTGIAGFEKYVAVKMIHPNFSQDQNFIEMLIDEAKISVQLQHVNIAQTFDLGRVGDTYYITMEFVDGADLYKILRRASEKDIEMPADVAAFIAKEMANGLDYAHRRRGMDGAPLGIVHRDVSPQNVLISHTGEIKLVDFGIAKATMKARQTAVGVIKGKYYYMSPEQAWGDQVDHRTDIFSVGILLYEALTGQMLYLEEDLQRLLGMVRKANIPPPTRLRRDIPPQLERIVMHALKKRKQDRYQTAGDMATDLERFLHVYSPVFRPSKVVDFFHQVLDQEPPPPGTNPSLNEIRPPSTLTGRLADGEVLRERSEFKDENSVIFRMSEFTDRRAGSAGKPRRAGQSTRPIPPMAAQTSQISDLDNIEEQTVVSASPMQFARPSRDPDFGPSSDFEPTVVESGVDGGGDEGHHYDLDDMDSAPTVTEAPPQRPPVASDRRRGAPAHPALAAKTPAPAVSAIHAPRQSRKTPARGTPAPSPSLLSSLVGGGDVPAVKREAPASRPSPAPEPHPQFPLRAPPTPVPRRPGMGVPAAVRNASDPFMGNALDPFAGNAPDPFTGNAPDPFTPLPSGAPALTLTKQLAAIQLDEIPDHLKLTSTRPRWLFRMFLVIGLVAAGVGIGVTMFGGQQKEREYALSIKTIPPGARVKLDGSYMQQTTPIHWTGAEKDQSYQLEVELDDYVSVSRKVIMDSEDKQVVVMLERKDIHVTLVVESEPKGAEIFIGGTSYGRAPKRIPRLDPERATTLELRLRGHETYRETLDWGQDKQLERHIELPKK